MTPTTTAATETARGAMREAPGATRRPVWKRRLQSVAGGLVLCAVMAAAGYVGGRVHAWNDLREVRAQLQVAVDEHQRAVESAARRHRGELAQLQTKLDAASSAHTRLAQIVDLDAGLLHLGRAIRALDARNFGQANDALRGAQEVLAKPSSAVEGLAPVIAQIERVDLAVASDFGAQREQLLSIVDRLDPIVARAHAARGAQASPNP